MSSNPPIPRRFERQARFEPLGEDGQRRLFDARVVLVGTGALGGVLAQTFVRAGVGSLVLVDRDVVCETNLARQVLFWERHVGTAKVDAARETLAEIGGPTRLETHATHVDATNVEELAEGADLVVDGTDNLQTRYLINDWSVDTGTPWVYGGVVGASGLVLAIVPGRGPCLACLFPEPPPPGTLATCDTAGVLLPAVGAIASLQAGLALRLLARPDDATFTPELLELDAWSGSVRRIRAARDPDCAVCARGELRWLDASEPPDVVLCGRNAVQVQGSGRLGDVDALARTLEGEVDALRRAGDLLRIEVDSLVLTLFPDGRALVEGTGDAGVARAAYERWIAS